MKNDAIKIFEQYISKFDLNNEKVRWKYLHSYRVAFLMEWLARKLKLAKNDVIVAYILGLFHDIGRFPQLDKFDSYNDLNIDHGDLGYKILKEEGLLDTVLDKKILDSVALGVKYHNKYEVDSKYLSNTYIKMIRDCDKLDILRAIGEDRFVEDTEIPEHEDTRKEFYKNMLVKYQEYFNCSDYIILYYSYIYDVNYKEIMKIIYKEKLLDKINKVLKLEERYKDLVVYADKYMKEVIKC